MTLSAKSTTVLAKVAELAADRRGDDATFRTFLDEYYAELPAFDTDDRGAEVLFAAAVAHYDFGRTRQPGQTKIAVISPSVERDGWHSDRSIVLIVTDDAPFLVDTVRIVLEGQGVSTHLLVHPVIHVTRDAEGHLITVNHAAFPDDPRVGVPGEIVEAWTQIEVDRLDSARAESLREALAAAIESVHRVVADFPAMRERLNEHRDLDPIIPWLVADNFVFLGAVRYELHKGKPPTPIADSTLGQAVADGPIDPPLASSEPNDASPTVTITRSAATSWVHRNSRFTVVSITFTKGKHTYVDRFSGLMASTAYRESVLAIPSVGDRARSLLGLAERGANTHTGRLMRNVLETLPRDVVFEQDPASLAQLVMDVVAMQERQIVRVFDVPDPVGDLSTVLVFIPKSRFTGSISDQIAGLVSAAYDSPVTDVETLVTASSLARVTMTVRRSSQYPGGKTPDLEALASQIDHTTTAWADRLREAAIQVLGEARAGEVLSRVGGSSPEVYRSSVEPASAVIDLLRFTELLETGESVKVALIHVVGADDRSWRVRVYRVGEPFVLAELMPMLLNMGFTVIEERPYTFSINEAPCYLYDIGVQLPADVVIDDRRHRAITAALQGLITGTIESDGYNRLVVVSEIEPEDVVIIRAYAAYAHQIGFSFDRSFIENTLVRLSGITQGLIELFRARFDPELPDATRANEADQRIAAIQDALDKVPSLDDDRIGRMMLTLVLATVRTNAFQNKPRLSLKFEPSAIPELPAPVPKHEIFVYSPLVEGVHLRGGDIARGGLRWSDRADDYRTEVLGLVKAQMVKNAIIVPVGAKGGFLLRVPATSREERAQRGREAYCEFVRGLLDVTDNIVGDTVVPPDSTVRYDGDDPYLVVAADKGTATFSDTANGISAEYGFWLGDAFASGGSEGYDHKAMGITARGAWESARRHAAWLGKNADTDELTVVGIGDMSGDVFGNGMLMSKHLRLVAAFDHRDIFVDPDPNPAKSWAERKRLFDLPGSSWQDYDTKLISAGGGVFSRSNKSITVTPEMAAVLGIEGGRLTPTELVSAILRAPVDMLWNGGIGTYVKASSESNLQVGDRANDDLRVNGNELRCAMVVEGGNLGLTQLGRVEYALNDGLIFTDAIDNSAGVDCSDHEVNVKILLNSIVQAGDMTMKQRNELLADMTDEVAELVLAHNRSQTLALTVARLQSLQMANVHGRYVEQLEAEGYLDRDLEFIPSDKQLAERQTLSSRGLVTPEFAVLIAYTKNVNEMEILQSDLPDDPSLLDDVVAYFPTPLREKYRDQIAQHQLRRQIATTVLANQMTDMSGISYDHRMTEDTGASVVDVTRAWLVARNLLDFPAVWQSIVELKGIAPEVRIELLLDVRRTAERCSLWFLRHRRPPVDITAEVARFREPMRELLDALFDIVLGDGHQDLVGTLEQRTAKGVPLDVAKRATVWRIAHTSLDVIEVAQDRNVDPLVVARAYWELFDRLELLWLWNAIGHLPRSDRWQTQARGALRDDLLTVLADLTDRVFEDAHGSTQQWIELNARSVDRAMSILTLIRRGDNFDVANLSVALRQLRNLVLTSVSDTVV